MASPTPSAPPLRPRPGRLAALIAVVLGLAAPAWAEHRLALWHVVHSLCTPLHAMTGLSAPCLAVDVHDGYAVVPDPGAHDDLLLVPTRRITGIEDPELLRAGAPNYWRLAWGLRGRLAARLHATLPREDIGMAVNAASSRSQDQLHIHVSCVRADVARELAALGPTLGDRWSTVELARRQWRVRLIAGDDLADADPFKLLASDPSAAADMADQTLVLIGATLPDGQAGFYVVNRTADQASDTTGHGEFLLDERCSTVRRSPSRDGANPHLEQ